MSLVIHMDAIFLATVIVILLIAAEVLVDWERVYARSRKRAR